MEACAGSEYICLETDTRIKVEAQTTIPPRDNTGKGNGICSCSPRTIHAHGQRARLSATALQLVDAGSDRRCRCRLARPWDASNANKNPAQAGSLSCLTAQGLSKRRMSRRSYFCSSPKLSAALSRCLASRSMASSIHSALPSCGLPCSCSAATITVYF